MEREWGHCLTLHFDEQLSARAQIDFSPTATTQKVGVVQSQATTPRLALASPRLLSLVYLSVSFVWLNQRDQRDQIYQTDQTDQINPRSSRISRLSRSALAGRRVDL